MSWSARLNPWIYRGAYRLCQLAVALRSRRWIEAGLAKIDIEGAPPGGVLLLAWGRIGDILLELPLIRGIRRLFPETPLVCLGRPEVGPLLDGEVDRFLAFCPRRWSRSPEFRRSLLGELGRSWVALFGDLHLFHGGLFYFRELFERLPARHRILYEGHGTQAGLAPWRPFPAGAYVVPARPVAPGSEQEPTLRHLWHDGAHYLSALCDLLGKPGPSAQTMGAPPRLLADPPGSSQTLLARHGLTPGRYVACQPASSSPKKDYPPELWRRVWEAFPKDRFVLLGSALETRPIHSTAAPLDLRGRTTLAEAVHLVRAAKAFVGLDSGLTHLAAHVHTPTFCISRASGLGYFFPYPPGVGIASPRVVFSPDFLECAGCLTICRREPPWRAYRQGALCLAALAPEMVIEALAPLLDQGPSAVKEGPELGV